MSLEPWLLELLACPECRGALGASPEGLSCPSCARAYRVSGGIPDLTAPASSPLRG